MKFYAKGHEKGAVEKEVEESDLIDYVLMRYGDGGMNEEGTAKAMQVMDEIRQGEVLKEPRFDVYCKKQEE